MRIVDVVLRDGAAPVELHPSITVVSGLSEPDRVALVNAVIAVASGEVPDVAVTLEAHDLIFGATATIFEVIKLSGTKRDPVVRRSDLPRGEDGPSPTPVPTGAAAEGPSAAEDAVTQAEAVLAALTEQRAQLVAADHDRRTEAGAERRRELDAMVATAADELERARVDLEACEQRHAAVTERRDRLQDLMAALEASEHAAVDLAAARAELAALESGAAAPDLAEALAQTEAELGALVDETVADADLPALLAARDALVALLDAEPDTVDDVDVSSDERVVAAREALVAARADLADAEAATRPLDMTDEEMAEIEAVHAEVEEAESGGRRAAKRLRRAQQRLDDLLAQHGLPSMGAFYMRSSTLAIDQSAIDRVRAATEAVAVAEGRLEAVEELARSALAGDRTRAAMERAQARQRAIDEAAADVVALLPDESVDASDPTAVVAAVAAFETRGAASGGDLADRRRRLESELSRLRAEVATAEADRQRHIERVRLTVKRLESLETATVGLEDATRELDELHAERRGTADAVAAARSAVDAADQRVREARAAAGRADDDGIGHDAALADLDDRIRAAERDLDDARRRSAEVAAAPPASTTPSPTDGIVAGDLEVYLLARLAGQRSVGRVGSVPLVVDRAFDGLGTEALGSVLELLQRMASTLQTIVVSEDPDLWRWAEDLGLRDGMAVSV